MFAYLRLPVNRKLTQFHLRLRVGSIATSNFVKNENFKIPSLRLSFGMVHIRPPNLRVVCALIISHILIFW